jgi:hypothetical protein
VPTAAAKTKAGDVRLDAKLPTPAEARKRLPDAKDRPQPWLTSAGIEAALGVPEVHGPKVYQKP